MKKILAAVLIAALATPASAWEAQTTGAGLAEQAATSSKLHDRLVALGFTGGLYEELTVPPKDAPELIEALDRYSPSGGYVPDKRGRQFALGWLAAGAVLADSTTAWSVNHFFDPTTGKGASLETSFVERLTSSVRRTLGASDVPDRGMPAPDWVNAKENTFNLAGFGDQYAKAVRGATPGERSRAMAGALVAAGAIVHVLQDLSLIHI